MVDINDVALRAGVSTATVSRALSGKTKVSASARARVQRAAEELGYVVSSSASSLASGQTKNVGIVVPFLNRWYFASVVEGAEAALLGHGYDLTLYNLHGDSAQRESIFNHFLQRKRVDAVIAVSLELTDDEVRSLLALRKPLVGIGGPIRDVTTLEIDNIEVARLGTEHLLALGHTEIAHVGSATELGAAFDLGNKRTTGFHLAMQAAGLELHERSFEPADFTIPSGYEAGKRLLGYPRWRPTAILAASDEMAIGCILAARDLGFSVPGDVSVVGIDDHELAAFFGLTTIAQRPRAQGALAVELLMDELLNRDPARVRSTRALDVELVVRSSTSRPPTA